MCTNKCVFQRLRGRLSEQPSLNPTNNTIPSEKYTAEKFLLLFPNSKENGKCNFSADRFRKWETPL